MSEQKYEALQKRIEQLEGRVNQLEGELKQNKEETVNASSKKGKKKSKTDDASANALQMGERWLNNIGIALLLIGIAFLFKYSIDQGWLIPQVRSAIGLAAGIALLGSGIKMNSELGPLPQILMGGGIAAFYITGFATFQLFSFMPPNIVWGFMILTTVLAFLISLQQDEAVLAVVGTIGALGTPFMLYSSGGNIASLMVYFMMIIIPTMVLYIKKGWLSLLWSIAVGGLLVLGVAIGTAIAENEEVLWDNRWITFAGILLWAIASWLVPVFKAVSKASDEPVSATTHIMTLVAPGVALIFSTVLFDLTSNQAGMTAILVAVVGSIFYPYLQQKKRSSLASTHTFLGLVLSTGGLYLILDGEVLFAVFVVEVIALQYLAYRTGNKKLNVGAHILFGITVWWLINRLHFDPTASFSMLNLTSLAELGLILSGGLLIPQYLQKKSNINAYQLLSHLLLLYWIYQKLVPLENGQAWISLVWGLYAIVIIIAGLVKSLTQARLVGIATIFVVIIKLLLVDLAQLQAIWRILLFMGFGSILLIVGYIIQSKLFQKSS